MSVRLYVALGAGSVVVLGGALALSSYLTKDVEPPVSPPAVVAPLPRAVTPTTPELQRLAAPTEVAPTVAPVVEAARPALNTAHLPVALGQPAANDGGSDPDDLSDPFGREHTPELDYAMSLLDRPDAGAREFASATEVFERCMRQNPANARCKVGMAAAHAKYLEATTEPVTVPSGLDVLRGQERGVTRLRPEPEYTNDPRHQLVRPGRRPR